jgi:hypothetical protein
MILSRNAIDCSEKCLDISLCIIHEKEDEALQLFDENKCKYHFYNLGLMMAKRSSTFEKLFSKVIEKLVYFDHDDLLFYLCMNNLTYLNILLSKFDCPNVLLIIVDLLWTKVPEEIFDLFLNESLFDSITKISENNFEKNSKNNFEKISKSFYTSQNLREYGNLTPIQYVNFKLSKNLLAQPNYHKLCRFAFVQLENTMTKIFDDSNTGMLPELINLATQYHDF